MPVEIIEQSNSLEPVVRSIAEGSLVKTRYQELIAHIVAVEQTPRDTFHEEDQERTLPFLRESIPALKEVFQLHMLKTSEQRAALVENFEAGILEPSDLAILQKVFAKLVTIIHATPGLHRQSYVPLEDLRKSLWNFIQWVERKPKRDHRERIRARGR